MVQEGDGLGGWRAMVEEGDDQGWWLEFTMC